MTYQLSNSQVVLYKYSEPLFDNLVLFCPTTEDLPSVGVEGISYFIEHVREGAVYRDVTVVVSLLCLTIDSISCIYINQGGNMMMAVDGEMSDFMREVAAEFGVDFDKKKSIVMDHFSYEPSLDTK